MKNNKKSFQKGIPQRKMTFKDTLPKHANLNEITANSIGRSFIVSGIIDSVSQTSGPTLFSLTDGTGTLLLKGFSAPGERSYPEIKEEDAIQTTVQINEFNGLIEGEIKRIQKLSAQDAQEVRKKIENLERERSKPRETEFMIKSQILDKLKDRFIKAATEIRLAIIQNRPIIVRHHNDADGYSSGYALEKAILPLIEKQHSSEKAAWEFYLRAPCAAPFYEIDDSIRDTAMSLRNEAKFSNKMPLIIIADNGSSEEDLLGILQGKVHGISFVVVDHHFFEKDVISNEVLTHINPFLVGENGAEFSAGMLCSELARFINADVTEVINQIPAMAGIADRIDNPKAIDDYLKIASKKGYTKSLLADISAVIDFISAKIRFMEAREYIEILFGEPMEKQKKLVSLLAPYIKNLEKKGLEIAKTASKSEKIKDILLQTLFVEDIYPRGFYPKPGKCNGLLHDFASEKNPKVVSAGIGGDFITFRATDEANFSVHDFISHISDKLPESFVEGGGHKNAGAIKFVPMTREKVLNELKIFLKSR